MEIQHFSHQHPLVFCEQKSHENQAASCSGCDELVIGAAYCCTFCQFFLHKRCTKLSRIILHSLHPQHRLTLLAKSPYPNGIFRCDMCKYTRKSFSYHCSVCEFDLDISCAFHSKLTSKVDTPGGKKILINATKGEKKPLGEIGKLEMEKKWKGKTFEAKGSREEKKPIHVVQVLKNSLKRDTFGGKQRSSLYLGKEDTHFRLNAKVQRQTRAKIPEPHDPLFRGKKSYLKSDKGKDIVQKEIKQRGGIGELSSKSPSPIIFRTPFSKLEFQIPELVSIGPYHSDEEHQLDKYKHSFLDKFLSRTSNNPEKDLCFYVREIIALENQARACYSEELLMSSRDFVKMMLVDGCFIIELLRYFGGSEGELSQKDPISIIMPWQIPILVQDLLQLENQIPFFVLQKLFDMSKNHEAKPEASLKTIAVKFFDLAFSRSSNMISEFSFSEFSIVKPINHLLDLFVNTIQYPSNPWNISNLLRPENRGKWDISHLWELIVMAINLVTTASNGEETENHPFSTLFMSSGSQSKRMGSKFMSETAKHKEENQSPIQLENVAALRQAGIEFMPSRYNNFLDVNFKDGVIQIPVVIINNLFKSVLVNSMALENCTLYYNKSKPMTSYIYFMSCLIKDANDAEFLCSKGIISRFSANDKKVADFFNLLWPYVVNIDMSNSHLWKTIRAVESYNGQSRKQMLQFFMKTSASLIWLICLPDLYWRNVMSNRVKVLVIVFTFFAAYLLFFLPSLR